MSTWIKTVSAIVIAFKPRNQFLKHERDPVWSIENTFLAWRNFLCSRTDIKHLKYHNFLHFLRNSWVCMLEIKKINICWKKNEKNTWMENKILIQRSHKDPALLYLLGSQSLVGVGGWEALQSRVLRQYK